MSTTKAARLSAKHRHMLEVERGIAPEVIAARGYYTETDPARLRALGFAPAQCRSGLVIPEWTTAGVQRGYKLRPDDPRAELKTDPTTGKTRRKPIKYENPAGARHQIDVPPGVVPLLRDPTIPLHITEGSPKADAAWSCGLACISLGGVWAFLRDKLVIHDFDDIALDGRLVRIAFDSDVMRKASVRDALERLAAALERRGAVVEAVYLPDTPAGDKVGLDDFFAAGGTIAELEALTRPWQAETPPLVADPDDPIEELARVCRERDELKRTISMLFQVCLNPHLKAQQKVACIAVFGLAQQKRDRGEVEPDGTVHLPPAEISDDWRAAPEPGAHVEPLNPDGSRPRMAREQVRPLLKEAAELGLLPASPRPTVRRRADGSTYKDTDWAIAPPASLSAFLAPAASWRPKEITPRKPRRRELACPHCNEVHPVVRTDTCQGCGVIRHEEVMQPSPARDMAASPMSDKSSDMGEAAMSGTEGFVPPPPPAAPPRSTVRKTIGYGVPGWAPTEPAPADRYTDVAYGRAP